MINFLKNIFHESHDTPIVDYLPVRIETRAVQAEIMEAWRRYGKPFKCGPDYVDREVMDRRGFISIMRAK